MAGLTLKLKSKTKGPAESIDNRRGRIVGTTQWLAAARYFGGGRGCAALELMFPVDLSSERVRHRPSWVTL